MYGVNVPEITPSEVDLLRREYFKKLEKFLLQQGWSVSDDGFDTWSKGPLSLLTNEEAYWREIETN